MKKVYIITLLMLLALVRLEAQITLHALNTPYAQDFNMLAASGTTNDIATVPAGWSFLEYGTNANTTYASGTGSSNAGNTYSFGTDASDRAFGGLLSGSISPVIGSSFFNASGSVITTLTITYKGEQWRLGAAGRGADRIDFQYSTDATSLASGDWLNVDELDFSSPVTAGTVGALNGNLSSNQITISFELSGLQIQPNSTFFIRWLDFNAASSDDGLAIDDFSIVPRGVSTDEPMIVLTPSALNFGERNVNDSDTLSYEVITANLTDSITISTSTTSFMVSNDNILFSYATILPSSGGLVYVRFAPISSGSVSGEFIHASDTLKETIRVSGIGYDPIDNIISISEARTKIAGTKVTVAGRITVAGELGNPAYLQDATGGIPAFYYPLTQHAAIGDSVIVTGPIGVFNEQVQISGAGIDYTRIETAPRSVAPKLIVLDSMAAYEGQLVTVQNVQLVNKTFVFYPQSTERITNGTTQADIRIDGDTGLPGLEKPQDTFNITGVVGRFRANAQLLPRFAQDVPGAIEPVNTYDSIAKSKTLDVVNWNFEFFGARSEDYGNEEFGPEDEVLQLTNIKLVLDSLKADIIAVQEVSDESFFSQLVSQLDGYAYTCSERYSYSFEGPNNTFPPQKVCFIYDTLTISKVSESVLFENLYDSARTIDPSLLPNYPSGNTSSFYSSGRLPYLMTAHVTIEGVTEEISFINIHAKSGATPADRNRREYDAAVLKDSLDSHFESANFIILGDLNDDLDESIATGLPTPYQPFVTDSAGYGVPSKALSEAGARSTVSFGDVIDHQIISNELVEDYLNGSAQIVAPFRWVENYAATTSDHLPVVTRFALQAPIASFVDNGISLTEDSATYTVSINVSKPIKQPTLIKIRMGGNAILNADFVTTPAPKGDSDTIKLMLAEGAVHASFEVTVLNDSIDEIEENTIFTLLPANGITISNDSTFTLMIEDNDVPTISFKEKYAHAKEGSGEYEVKLILSTPPVTDQTATITVYSTPWIIPGQDYQIENVTGNKVEVFIPAGSSEASFSITPEEDTKRELPVELLTFYLSQTSDGLESTQPRISLFGIVDVKKKKTYLYVYPNPTKGTLNLTSAEYPGNTLIDIEIGNDQGIIIYKGSTSIDDHQDKISSLFGSLRKGTYILKSTINNEEQLLRVIKN
jgi:endonuclease/exonuclease/phosphatase family metal-dependent hydrolase